MVVLTSFSAPTEGIRHSQPSTSLFIKGREVGVGTLYIAESNVSWRNDASGEGFSLLYPSIAVHGISRDVEQLGCECLYIMVDACLDEMHPDEEGEENGDGDSDSEGSTEMRFAPADKGQLDSMYRAMSYCQALHPDPEASPLSEDEDEAGAAPTNGVRLGEEEMETDGQFEDAEDD
uniref:Methylosome subunit pICln n=1 Tax=Graphocephala atropunctata TaxID=36148 RepID=A0A1B6M1L3_9HEMI